MEISLPSQYREVKKRETMEARKTRCPQGADGEGRGGGAGKGAGPVPPGRHRGNKRKDRSHPSRDAAAKGALVGDRSLGRGLGRGSSLGRHKRRSPTTPQGAPSIMTNITRKSPDPWVSVRRDPRSTKRYQSRFQRTTNKNGHMSAEALKMAVVVEGGHSHVSVPILRRYAQK